MKIINRPQLQQLIRLQNTPDIKIITGVRRAGKSFLLRQLEGYIKQHEPAANVISLDLTAVGAATLRTQEALYAYVSEHYQPHQHNVVLLDEIEMCQHFELAVNALHAELKYDIYLTGSNAFLLTSDLATLFAGRFFRVEVFPFSFAEFLDYFDYQDLNPDEALTRYLDYGGLAGSYLYQDPADRRQYAADLYESMIIRDIQQKYQVKNTRLLDSLGEFLLDNIGNITSPRKIADTLTSARQPVNHTTIGQYLHYFETAFAFYKIGRYNIKGRLRLATLDKYYVVDPALRTAKLGPAVTDSGRVLENVVALELLRRGFEVSVGVFGEQEIDFVALKNQHRLYLQVTERLETEATWQREVAGLLRIHDAYPKIILARTNRETQISAGVQIVDVARWLRGDQISL